MKLKLSKKNNLDIKKLNIFSKRVSNLYVAVSFQRILINIIDYSNSA